MPNDPILDAIQGGGTAVSDDDPILTAIQSGGTRSAKSAAAKPTTPRAADTDPIMAAIQGESDGPVTPFSTIPNPAGSLTERAARLGKLTLPLPPAPTDTTQIPLNVFSGAPQGPGFSTEEEKQANGTIGPPSTKGTPYESIANIGEGIKRVVGAGAPEGSEVARLTGQRGTRDDVRLLAPEEFMSSTQQAQHPILTGAGQFAGGMTSPDNLMLLGMTAGAGELAGPGFATTKKLLAAGFTIPMLISAARQAPEVADAFRRGDSYNAKRLLTQMALTAGTAGLAAHGMFDEPPSPFVEKSAISKPLAIDEANARSERAAPINAQAQAGLGNVDQAVAKTIGGGNEKLAPESPATLRAQTDALAKGTNPVVYFPKGTETIPTPPENAQVTIVPGDKPGAGTYYHDDSVTPADVRKAVKNGTVGELLGHEQTKEEAAKGQPIAVVARDENGIEQKASLVDAGNPDALTRQAQTLQDQFPQGRITVESPQQVIERRAGGSATYAGPERRSLSEIQGPSPMRAGLVKQLTDLTNDSSASTQERSDAQARLEDIKANPFESGENLGEEIRQARAKSSGQPMGLGAAQANEAARKAENSQTPSVAPQVSATATTKIPRTPPGKLEKFKGDPYGQKVAQLSVNRMRDPIEREYAMSYLKARLAGKSAPTRISSIDANRAATLKSRIESELQRTAPKALTEKYSPDTLEAAREELQRGYDLASNFERPGRYQSVVEGSRYEVGGTWYGLGSSRHIVADQFPWYKEIEQGPDKIGALIKKGKGAEYERLLDTVASSVEREKESAAPVVAEFAPRLRDLSNKIDGNDPDLSESLAQLANGDGRGFKNLREYLDGRVTDAERANSFFTAIDDAAAEARQAGAPEAPGHRSAIRPAESGRFEAPESPRAEGSRAFNQASEASETANTAEGLSRHQPRTLPGMESAVSEQKKAAGQFQAKKLSDEINKAPASIEEAAGRMERESPLFRHTAANPQSDMFTAKAEPKPPEVGDTIQPTSGKLSGQTLEVTKVGETGVYARQADGPIKFVRNGEFENHSEADRYSGIHPKELIAGSRLLQRVWDDRVAQPLIDKVLKLGDKYSKAREADQTVAEGLHLLDNAPTYLRAKAAAVVKGVVGNLSRAQERLFVLVADADSRENLRENHPREYAQAQNDPAIQAALKKYRPVEQETTQLRQKMGGQVLDRDYLRRVYDKYVAGVNKAEAPGTPERGTSAFDRVIRPQRTDKLTREATAEYHYQNGLHEFGPSFATKYIATHLKALRDGVAREFLSKATMLPTGASEPRLIEYGGKKYYRPDVARDMREAGSKNVQTYDRYDPTAGEKFPVPVDGKYLGPRELVKTLTDFGRKEEGEPGALRRFFQEQILGFGFGVPHVFNIMRRVSQSVPLGAVNPQGWARAWKVVLSRELRARGISGLDDPTFDMLAKHGAISTGEVSNLKAYIGGNINPANWLRSLAQVGHKFLFEPTSAKGFGGLDQRARVYVADLVKSQRPDLSDAKIAEAVRTQLGDYNRANWTDQQKLLAKFMMFPGWDTSSIRWVIKHPIKTTVPPALMVLAANRVLNQFGQNRNEDRNDISSIHIGDRDYSTGLLRESVARNLFRPVLNFAQSKLRGESNQRAFDAASRGITAGAGGLLGMLRPDVSGFLALATNRQGLFSGKEIVSPKDYETPGKILPSKALEKQAVFTLRHAVPSLDRLFEGGQDVDWKSFVGGNLGTPNYPDGAEERLKRNVAESNRVYQSISRLAKTDPKNAVAMLKDPDNAAYALFHSDLSQASAALRKIDQVRAAVEAGKMDATQKEERLKALDNARQMFVAHADGLNNLLFKRRSDLRNKIPATQSGRALTGLPLGPPRANTAAAAQ